MRKISQYLLVLLFLSYAGFPSAAGNLAYVLRFDPDPKTPPCIVQFDADKDEVIRKIEIPDDSGFNGMVIDEKGGCYISVFRKSWDYGQDIYYYDVKEKKIKHFIDLHDVFGPKKMFLRGDELIVEVEGNDDTRLKSGILFINRETGQVIKRIFLHEGDPYYGQENINNLCYDGGRYLFLTTFYQAKALSGFEKMYELEDTSDIYVIDVVSREVKTHFPVPREYRIVDGLVNYGDKLYVTALAKGTRTSAADVIPSNEDLLVFSLSTGKLEKTIAISPHARAICFDRSVNKLYVLHINDYTMRNTIEVIDADTDKIVNRLTLPSQLMFSVVKPGKIYMTSGPSFMNFVGAKPSLFVLDTKNDKFIKEFEGSYQGISINSKYY